LVSALEHYVRHSVREYEAIRDAVLGRSRRPPLGALPSRAWSELLVRLTPAESAVHVECWWGGEQLADTQSRLSRLLGTGTDTRQSEQMLTETGRVCGSLLFPPAVADRVTAFGTDRRQGDRLDVVIEAASTLSRLPFEAARLPAPGAPLLVAQEGLTLLRRPLAPPARSSPALPGPLKILVAIAAPDEHKTASSVLDVERELARILEALPEHGAQARPLEVAGLDQIAAALGEDAYHVLHLSGHGSAEGIELENEDGDPVLASPAEIVAAIDRGGEQPLPLLFLSCCDPSSGADTAPGLAEALLAAGLSQVVALRGNASDAYATRLAAKFYGALARGHDVDAPRALAAARRELELERERLAGAEQGATPPAEYATAAVFCAGLPEPIVCDGEPASLRRRSPVAPHGQVPMLGVDDLVGRRREVRTALHVLCDDPRSPGTAVQRGGVVLHGLGGVGKSTIAGRVMARLADRGWVIAPLAGTVELSALCEEVAEALDELDDDAATSLAGRLLEQAPDELRRARLQRAVRDHRVLVVLDNFEDNLGDAGEAFRDDATEELLGRLLGAAERGRLLVTSRFPVGPYAAELYEQRVGPLSRSQSRKLLLRLPALGGLPGRETAEALRLTGGHPRLVELVDADVRGDAGRLTSMAERLAPLAAELGVDLATPREDLDAALADALDLQLRDIALKDLAEDLPAEARELLLQAAVSNIPVAGADLAAMIRLDVGAGLEPLLRRALVSPVATDLYFVERWTAEGLRKGTDDEGWRMRCRRAAEQRRQRNAGARIESRDAMEAARNLRDAGDLEEAAGLASSVARFLTRSDALLTVAGFASDILAQLPLTIEAARARAARGGRERSTGADFRRGAEV
jgi:Mrp family chromosome partitioning ATPase